MTDYEEEIGDGYVQVTAKDPNDGFELVFKVKITKPVKKVVTGWYANIPAEKRDENLKYNFYFGNTLLQDDITYQDVPLMQETKNVLITVLPEGQEPPPDNALRPTPSSKQPESTGKEEVQEEQNDNAEQVKDQKEFPDLAQYEYQSENVQRDANIPIIAGAEDIPETATEAVEERTPTKTPVTPQEIKDVEMSAANEAVEREEPAAEAAEEPTLAVVSVPEESAAPEDTKDAEMPPAPEEAAAGEAAAGEAEVVDDQPITVFVRDKLDGDVLTFRVRRSKTVGKMFLAWKGNQTQVKMKSNTFEFYHGDQKLVDTMTFGEIRGLTEGADIEVRVVPKESKKRGAKKDDAVEGEKKPKAPRVAPEGGEAAPKAPRPKPTGGTGANVGMDDPIELVANNPKRAGTKSYDRYELYKGAKTKREYFDLGGAKGDFPHDFGKGYITVLSGDA